MIRKWKKIKEEPLREGFRKLIKKTFKLPNDKVYEFEIKNEGKVVCILALTEDKKVILVKQYRPGMEKILLEMPGGAVDGKENLIEAIERELLEETGYSGNVKFVGAHYTCAYSTGLKYTFVATNCHKIIEQKLDETEFIEVVLMSLKDFREHLRSGELTDVENGYLGLDYLKLL